MTTRKKRSRPVKLPRGKLSDFVKRLFTSWKKLALPTADAAVVIAVSGGADSTALLLAVEELIRAERLHLRVIAAHLDHALRPESRADAQWVVQLANKLRIESVTKRVNVRQRAAAAGDNLEQAARHARYEFLLQAAKSNDAAAVLTAHTMDDQAETVILRLLRGSGTDGLAGIEPTRRLSAKSSVLLVRPLLNWARRSDTEQYCHIRKVDYLVDAMNSDQQFNRVRVRTTLLPQMQTFNARIVESLARTAELLRDETEVLAQQAQILLDSAASGNKRQTTAPALSVKVLAQAPVALRRRALRQWIFGARGDLRRVELLHIRAIEKLLFGQQGGRLAELPGGGLVVRRKSRIELQV